jgi:hypothetical protein
MNVFVKWLLIHKLKEAGVFTMINGYKSYIGGGFFMILGGLQLLCSVAKICVIPEGAMPEIHDPLTGNPLVGAGLLGYGWAIIANAHKQAKQLAATQALTVATTTPQKEGGA